MSQEGPNTTRLGKAPMSERSVPIPTVAALLAAALAGGGGAGSAISGRDVASELREFRVEVRADLAALRQTIVERDKILDRLLQSHEALSERVRKVELEAAARSGPR